MVMEKLVSRARSSSIVSVSQDQCAEVTEGGNAGPDRPQCGVRQAHRRRASVEQNAMGFDRLWAPPASGDVASLSSERPPRTVGGMGPCDPLSRSRASRAESSSAIGRGTAVCFEDHRTLWDSGCGPLAIYKYRATVCTFAAGRLVLRAGSRRPGAGCQIPMILARGRLEDCRCGLARLGDSSRQSSQSLFFARQGGDW